MVITHHPRGGPTSYHHCLHDFFIPIAHVCLYIPPHAFPERVEECLDIVETLFHVSSNTFPKLIEESLTLGEHFFIEHLYCGFHKPTPKIEISVCVSHFSQRIDEFLDPRQHFLHIAELEANPTQRILHTLITRFLLELHDELRRKNVMHLFQSLNHCVNIHPPSLRKGL